ncbi:hypothetical protein FPV67DRAFT_1446800 [Lyophyllum atratum]|nr:hypothetical protein FPV67DRAFT_1446800 [Lyophyllum atratum]
MRVERSRIYGNRSNGCRDTVRMVGGRRCALKELGFKEIAPAIAEISSKANGSVRARWESNIAAGVLKDAWRPKTRARWARERSFCDVNTQGMAQEQKQGLFWASTTVPDAMGTLEARRAEGLAEKDWRYPMNLLDTAVYLEPVGSEFGSATSTLMGVVARARKDRGSLPANDQEVQKCDMTSAELVRDHITR